MTSDEFAACNLIAVRRFATVLTGDQARGDDLVQEVLVRVHARSGGGQPGATPAAGGPHPRASRTAAARVLTAAYIVGHAPAAEARAARMIQVTRSRAGVSYLNVVTQQDLFVSARRTMDGKTPIPPRSARGSSRSSATGRCTAAGRS